MRSTRPVGGLRGLVSKAAVLAVAALLPSATFAAQAAAAEAAQLRDGSHDFDWEIGTWHTHLRVLRRQPDGNATWIAYEGTSVVRPIWSGRANMVELEADGPGQHIDALSLRLYDLQSHQWSLNFANAKAGTMSGPPTVGEFENGIGTFTDQEAIGGRMVWVRGVFSNVSKKADHFEQAISDDGGKTWQVNWIADDTRLAEP